MWQQILHINRCRAGRNNSRSGGCSRTPAEVMTPPYRQWVSLPLAFGCKQLRQRSCDPLELALIKTSHTPLPTLLFLPPVFPCTHQHLQQCSESECSAILCSVMKDIISITHAFVIVLLEPVWRQARCVRDWSVTSSCWREQMKNNDHLCTVISSRASFSSFNTRLYFSRSLFLLVPVWWMVACCPVREGREGQFCCTLKQIVSVEKRFLRLWGAGWCWQLIDWLFICWIVEQWKQWTWLSDD